MAEPRDESFEEFFNLAEPRLRRALSGRVDPENLRDAVAAALLYAFEHWERIRQMDLPLAYLYRVGLSSLRRRRQGYAPPEPASHDVEIEPALVEAMKALSQRQREVVWLVDGCGWSIEDTATALRISHSAARTHRERALRALRHKLGVEAHG